MKFGYIALAIVSLLFSSNITPIKADTNLRNIHKEQHKQLLANQKSQLDPTVVQAYLIKDIEQREKLEFELNLPSEESELLVTDLLSEARRHMGKKYVWGTQGPNTFDCSGFSSYVYKQFGYKLSPSSKVQYTQGTPVDKKRLRPGDLVFFQGRNGKSGVVGHVGIVISADNEQGTFNFIHASISGVKIDSSSAPYYSARYIGAKRIIED